MYRLRSNQAPAREATEIDTTKRLAPLPLQALAGYANRPPISPKIIPPAPVKQPADTKHQTTPEPRPDSPPSPDEKPESEKDSLSDNDSVNSLLDSLCNSSDSEDLDG